MPISKVVMFCDGGARGNPGPAGIGAALFVESDAGELEEFASVSEYIGTGTNNEAEYAALIAGLEVALEYGASDIEVRADSELIVRQLSGQYRVKSANLKPLHAKAMSLLGSFESWRANHVAREQNRRADSLVNDALDAHLNSHLMRDKDTAT
ncbi:MAG: ribonuclease H [Acidobacteria bacterium]|nr:MAG: ribonuclease H [Acidobacteriota bacterium]